MGVDIETIEPGDGKTFAKKGDTVEVHYQGTFKKNGKKFDSSYDRGRPFKTKIGLGCVIKGWDEAILQMSEGQKAKLTITPDYAYGAKGCPGTIGPNETLVFEVYLVHVIHA